MVILGNWSKNTLRLNREENWEMYFKQSSLNWQVLYNSRTYHTLTYHVKPRENKLIKKKKKKEGNYQK